MTGPVRLGPQLAVEAPKAQPPAGGLVSLARRPDLDAEGRWELGYSYRPEMPSGSVKARSTLDGFYGTDLGAANDASTRVSVIPVYLTVTDVNSTLGFNAIDHQAKATRLLEAYTSKELARELWTGEISQHDGSANPRLAGPNTIDITTSAGGPLEPQAAVAALMQGLADHGMGDGMMHCSRRVGIQMPAPWRNKETLEEQGFCVVTDPGYPGSGPTGDTTSQWMYATEIVNVRLGEIELIPDNLRQSVNISSNTITYRAQRVAAADFAGPVLAIRVSA